MADIDSDSRNPELDSENRDRIVGSLKANNLDAVLCSLPIHVLLLTGYWPVMANSVALFTRDAEMHLLLPEDEAELAHQMSVAQQTTFRPGSLDRITDAKTAITKPLLHLVRGLGLERARIGMELSGAAHATSYLSQYSYETTLEGMIEDKFGGIKIASADQMLRYLESIKTSMQMEAMRLSCRVASEAYKRARTRWQAGMTEAMVAETFRGSYSEQALDPKVLRSVAYFFCMSGENSVKAAAAYARTRRRQIQQGDIVMIHCNSNVDGYWTDITRTYVCGELNAKQRQMSGAIKEARLAALAAISPGARAADVDRAAREVLNQHGFGDAFKHATGHGVGFSAANHNAVPRIHPKSQDTLEVGMTFNIEPAIYLEDYGGMRHCDVVSVTKNGAEVLSAF